MQDKQPIFRASVFSDTRGHGFEVDILRMREGDPVVTGSVRPSYRWPVAEEAQRAADRSVRAVEESGKFPNWCDSQVCEALGSD